MLAISLARLKIVKIFLRIGPNYLTRVHSTVLYRACIEDKREKQVGRSEIK